MSLWMSRSEMLCDESTGSLMRIQVEVLAMVGDQGLLTPKSLRQGGH